MIIVVEEDPYVDIDPVEEHYKETKKAFDEAMKLPTTKERIEYFKKGIYDRIYKRMLHEVGYRK